MNGSGSQSFIRPHLRKLAAYTPIEPFEVLSKRLGRDPADIVKLDANENPYGPPQEVLDALGSMPFPNIYPDPETRRLRSALAERNNVPMENLLVCSFKIVVLKLSNAGYTSCVRSASWSFAGKLRSWPDMIMSACQVGCGADELIDLLMRCVLDPGDSIVDCPPTFTMYAFDAAVNGAEVVTVPRLDGFRLDVEGKSIQRY
jgi:histidinol-phosphate aminotransferase